MQVSGISFQSAVKNNRQKANNQRQNNSQPAFGMALTLDMRKVVSDDLPTILELASKEEIKLGENLPKLDFHPLLVDWKDGMRIINDKLFRKVATEPGADFEVQVAAAVKDLSKYDELSTATSDDVFKELEARRSQLGGESVQHKNNAVNNLLNGRISGPKEARAELNIISEDGLKAENLQIDYDTYNNAKADLDAFFPHKLGE